ncbi:probable glycosyltransferase At5g03795 [Amaranthus tricolor]|uniref:probable glycosyltransferase At5g03795 n=1 Tax=Amaranthus tricolor TaxID=29722 RepID=UPI002585123B|nr:probable glycosyltransferase At5g03795 [Amaranthus tricolor]
MGFEFLKAFQVQSRRFLWLIGLVFATILLFQSIELPKGNALWSMFSWGQVPEQQNHAFFGENSTLYPLVFSNVSSHDFSNSSMSVEQGRDGPILDGTMLSNTTERNASVIDSTKDHIALPPTYTGDFNLGFVSPSIAPSPIDLILDNVARNISIEFKSPPINSDLPPLLPPLVNVRAKKQPQKPGVFDKEVFTLSDMSELLVQNYVSPPTMIPRWASKVDEDLVLARQLIENAPPLKDDLYAPLYRNASMFQRSYELMEKMLKVYIYREGDRRIFHRPPLEGIYASEGWFMKLIEADRHFVTKRAKDAHLFYLPFSSRQLEETLYVPNSHNHKNLIQHLKDYVDMISAKYPFWNRTDGADHFLVACHDWAPSETKKYMANCIRALCNADVKEKFKFGKDVSLPETYVRKARNPLRDVGGKPLSNRKTLAFYAGNMHGYLRPILLEHWGNNKDPDMHIFEDTR